MTTLKEWQVGIRKYAASKGFNWTKAEIDTMLLRMVSEICEAAEAARDIPIKKKVKILVSIKHTPFANLILGHDNEAIPVNNDGTFDTTVKSHLYTEEDYEINVKGHIIEEFEPDEHVAEELADVFIRLADTTKVLGIDLEAEVWKKHEKNMKRPPKHGRGRK